MAQIEPKESKSIPEGAHQGEIISNLRKVPGEKDEKGNVYKFDYTDYNIRLEDVEGNPTLKIGFPTDVSYDAASGKPTTKHGRFLAGLGVDITKPFDTDEVNGKKVKFATENDENGFARVIGSIKPIQ